MAFHPEEILFSPTAKCNLACPHCNVIKSEASLSAKLAKRFLIGCKKYGINRIGFTGGEPFLAPGFLYSITRFAVENGLLFTGIVTNGVWYRNNKNLEEVLRKLFEAGYDGSILLSVDAYHKQDVRKLARFIDIVQSVWLRPDIVSILYVTGRDRATKRKISKLAGILGGRLIDFGCRDAHIRASGLFIKMGEIDISPVGKAARLKDPWDGRWFREDYCKGPGNLFFVEPSGEVKPCCGYAAESKALGIGNMKRDSVSSLIKNIRQNRIVYAIFNSGLARIRKRLIRHGVKLPGKTSNHCFFCHYMLTEIPRPILLASLKDAYEKKHSTMLDGDLHS